MKASNLPAWAAAVALFGCGVPVARCCAAPPAAASAGAPAARTVPLNGTTWRFVRVAGQPVPAKVPATLRLRGVRASGKAGCNSYGAAVELGPDGSARFSQIMSTQMACLQPAGAMQVGRGIVAAFRHTVKIESGAGELILLDAAGKPLATLKAE